MTAKRDTVTIADIESLFEKMHQTWGERFLKHWAGCDMAKTHKTWLEGLDGLDRKAIRYGTSAMLLDSGGPIDLPRFRALCLRQRSQMATPVPMLTDGWTLSPVAKTSLAEIRSILDTIQAPAMPIEATLATIPLPPEVPSPHIYRGDESPLRAREPGDDDEELAS